jgi:hypothetical protein
MTKKLKTYIANGNIQLGPDSYIDIDNLEVQAYSSKQARLKVAFKVKEKLNDNVSVQAIFRALGRVNIRERN